MSLSQPLCYSPSVQSDSVGQVSVLVQTADDPKVTAVVWLYPSRYLIPGAPVRIPKSTRQWIVGQVYPNDCKVRLRKEQRAS